MSKNTMNNSAGQLSRAEQQAMYFVDKLCCDRLDSDAQVTELLSDLESWQRQDSKNIETFTRVMDSWADLAQLEGDAQVQSWAKTGLLHTGEQKAARKVLRAGHLAFGLAATILVAVVSWVFYSTDNTQSGAELLARYTTIVGEQRTVQLLDGSTITLNTDSSILLEYTNGYRRAILDYGEVFFDVKADLERPFTVETGARSITVLGTQFNVQKIRSHLTVAVIEGSVALHPKEERASKQVKAPNFEKLLEQMAEHDVSVPVTQQYRLESGAVLSLDNSGKLVHLSKNNSDAVSQYADWQSGKIRFKNRPLYDVIQEINRYTRRKIVIEDADIMVSQITVVVNVKNLDAVLAGLEASLPIRVGRYQDNIVLYRK